MTYPGVVVEAEIPVLVFLPPCYNAHMDRYPVVFLLHGFPFDEAQWQALGVFDLAEEAMQSSRWAAAILVAPNQPAPIFTRSDGGPNSYEREFLEGVLPFIETTFRVSEEVTDRSVVGISRGGVWALEIALRNPGTFAKVAVISPSLNVNYARNRYDPFWLVENGPAFNGTILIAVGEDDHSVRATAENLRIALDEAGIPNQFLLEAGVHDEIFWEAILDPMLTLLLAQEG